MSSIACRVCLRTNVPMLDLSDDLKTFHVELCDFESVQHKRLKCCALCAHQMEKCYKFKGQCVRANELLNLWIKHRNKDISEYQKKLPSQSLQIANNSNSFLFECKHDEKTLHNSNVTSDCNRNLVLKLNRSALAPDDRTDPESSEPSLNSNPSTPDRPYPDLRPAVRVSSGPALRPNIGSRPALRPNCGLRPKANLLTKPSRSAIRPNLVLRPSSGSKQPEQTVLNFDRDYDVSNETDPLSVVKDESATDIDENTMDIDENTMDIGQEESLVEFEKQDVYMDDNIGIDDAIASVIEIEQKEADKYECTFGTKPEEELYDNDSIDNKEELINNGYDIDSDEYTYEYLEEEVDLLHIGTNPKQDKLSEASSIEKKQAKKTTVNEPKITKLKIEDVVSKIVLQPARNETNIPLEAKCKRVTRKYNKKTKVNLKSIDTNRSQGFEAVPTFKEKMLGLFDASPFVLEDETVLTKELFSTIYENFNVRELKKLAVTVLEDDFREKLTAYLGKLYRKYNPEYESIFNVEYLHTDEKRKEEFKRRELHPDYICAAYKCELCYKTYTGQSYLDHHKETYHYPASTLVCSLCSYSMPSRAKLVKHLVAVHSAAYSCRLCPLRTNLRTVMINHYNTHRGVEYQCPVPECSKVCNNANTLRNHKRRAHPTHVCTTCALQYTTEKGLRMHREMQHKDAPPVEPAQTVPCAPCGITFDTRQSYLRHCNIAHASLPDQESNDKRRAHPTHVCTTCALQYTTQKGLRMHREMQHKDAPPVEPAQTVPCAPCGITFDTRQSYLRHCNIAHASLPDQESLPRRKRVKPTAPTTPRSAKKEKIKIENKRKVYRTCEICHEKVYVEKFSAFLYKHFLEKHPGVPYHAKDMKAKDFLCDECGKAFLCEATLRDHKNCHTGDRPYMCQQCPARFHAKGNLWKHRVQKHCERRHRCEECGKLFKNATHLRTHMKIHIGDRRFKCNICDKGFLHNCSLKEHVKGVHYKERRVKKPKKPAQEI